jgi:hypothetical protein
MRRSSELHTFAGGLISHPPGNLPLTGAMNGQWGRSTAVGLTVVMLCMPIEASAQVPQVTVPPVTVPPVTVPEVTVPPVVPQPLPQIPAPPVPTPSAPAPSAPAPGLPAPPSGATTASAPAADLGAIVERAAEAVWSADGAGADGGTAEDRAAARAERRAKRERARQVRRRLRRALVRHSDCRYLLTSREQRILRLHLGLGDREARSRQAVARRLDTSTRRIRRVERRAVVKLRRAGRSGICDSPGLTTVSAGLGGSDEAAEFAAALGAAGKGSDGGVLGARGSGGRDGDSPDAHADDRGGGPRAGGYTLGDANDGLATLAWIVLVATAVALLAGVFQLWRRGVLGLPDWLRRSGGPGR